MICFEKSWYPYFMSHLLDPENENIYSVNDIQKLPKSRAVTQVLTSRF